MTQPSPPPVPRSNSSANLEDELLLRKKGLVAAFEKIVEPLQEILDRINAIIRFHRVVVVAASALAVIILILAIAQWRTSSHLSDIESSLEDLLAKQQATQKTANTVQEKVDESARKFDEQASTTPQISIVSTTDKRGKPSASVVIRPPSKPSTTSDAGVVTSGQQTPVIVLPVSLPVGSSVVKDAGQEIQNGGLTR